jgi:PAS domain S-box-containing protein
VLFLKVIIQDTEKIIAILDNLTEQRERDKLLLKERRNLREIIKQSYDGILILNGDKVETMNAKFIKMFNINEFESITNIDELENYKKFAKLRCIKSEYKLIDRIKQFKSTDKHKLKINPAWVDCYDKKMWVDTNIYNVYNDDIIENTIVTFKDITEIVELGKKLKDSERNLGDFFDVTTDAFYKVDSELNIVYVNDKFKELYNGNGIDYEGMSIYEFIPERLRADEKRRVAKKIKERSKTANHRRILANDFSGNLKLLYVTSLLKFDSDTNKFTGSYGTIQDISDELDAYLKNESLLTDIGKGLRSISENTSILNNIDKLVNVVGLRINKSCEDTVNEE